MRGSQSGKTKSREKGKVQCFYYKEFSHIKRNCLERANSCKGDSPRIVVAKEENEQDEYLREALIVSKSMDTISQDECILGLCCPVYSFFIKEYFDSFKDQKTSVSLGDVSTCDIMCVRTMKFKMFDGVVYTLDDITYLKDINKFNILR